LIASDRHEWVSISNHERKSNPNPDPDPNRNPNPNSRLLVMVPPIEYGLGYRSRNKVQP